MAGQPATPASDIYSLACVLYEALAGAPPFLGQSPAEVAHARLEQDPPAPSSIRPGLSPALDAALIQGLRRRMEAEDYMSGEGRSATIFSSSLFGSIADTDPVMQKE